MIARRSEQSISSLIKIIMSKQICKCLDILEFVLTNCPDTSEKLSWTLHVHTHIHTHTHTYTHTHTHTHTHVHTHHHHTDTTTHREKLMSCFNVKTDRPRVDRYLSSDPWKHTHKTKLIRNKRKLIRHTYVHNTRAKETRLKQITHTRQKRAHQPYTTTVC